MSYAIIDAMDTVNWYIVGPLIAIGAVGGFVLWWCFLCWLIGNLGGWAGLAKQFPLTTAPPANADTWQSMRIGLFSYKNSLSIAATPDGLYLDVQPLFRPGHPPILIPWIAITEVFDRKQFMITMTYVIVNTSPRPTRLQLPQKLGHRLNLAHFATHKAPPPLNR